jgi:hypothetical protein
MKIYDQMRNFFDKFDRTLLCFISSLVLIGIVIATLFSVRGTADIQLVANRKTTLFNGELSKGEPILRGDTVTVLGQRIADNEEGMVFWVETRDGQRGYVPQEAFDDQAIIHDIEDIKANDQLSLQKGDTVTIIDRSKAEGWNVDFNFKTKEGVTGVVRHSGISTLTGASFHSYELQNRRIYFISKRRFEKLYLGKTFEEVDQLYRKALFVKASNLKTEAKYDLAIFNKADGKFYSPTILFEDNIATSYTAEVEHSLNSFLLKRLPLSDKVFDVHLFSNLISGLMQNYSNRWPDMNKVLYFALLVLIIIGSVVWMFLTNQILSLFLFGLLRFRRPLIFLGNNAVLILILAINIVCTYIWLILGLSYAFLWWIFIPILIIVGYFVIKIYTEFFGEFPSNRCPKCKQLYSIHYFDKTLLKEYDKWRKETKTGMKLGTKTTKWKTYDLYSDGSKRNWKSHQTSRSIHQMDVYDVLYRVREYEYIYKCSECHYTEHSYGEELTELDRKYLDSYTH